MKDVAKNWEKITSFDTAECPTSNQEATMAVVDKLQESQQQNAASSSNDDYVKKSKLWINEILSYEIIKLLFKKATAVGYTSPWFDYAFE